MVSAWVSGLVAGYGVAIPVGAIGILIIGLSARLSWRVGAGAALGVATADTVYAAVAVIGGTAIAGLIRPVATPLRIVAGLVLLGIAARIAVTAWLHQRDPARAAAVPKIATAPRAFVALLGLTMLNPATVIYFAALVLGRNAVSVTGDWPRSTVFVLAVLLASASWQLLLAAGGAALGRTLGSPRGRLYTALISSLLVVVLAVRTLWS